MRALLVAGLLVALAFPAEAPGTVAGPAAAFVGHGPLARERADGPAYDAHAVGRLLRPSHCVPCFGVWDLDVDHAYAAEGWSSEVGASGKSFRRLVGSPEDGFAGAGRSSDDGALYDWTFAMAPLGPSTAWSYEARAASDGRLLERWSGAFDFS